MISRWGLSSMGTGEKGGNMKLGIIGAMADEVALLKQHTNVTESVERCGTTYTVGTLNGHDVVLVVCGVGKVNAAVCAQVLVDCFEVTHLVFTGVAGSLNAEIDICDIVVSTDCVQHDMDASGLGYAPGVIPYQEVSFFTADDMLRSTVVRAVHEAAPEVKVFEGRIASGDQFVSDAMAKERIVRQFGALCCEMEGASVAQVAWLNGIPFVVVRAISDKADGSAEMDYPSFMKQAAHHSSSIVERLMQLL